MDVGISITKVFYPHSCYAPMLSPQERSQPGRNAMNRKPVVCPNCDLHFTSSREKTYCPGCHQLVEPQLAR